MLVDPQRDIDQMVSFAGRFINRVAVLGVHEQPRRHVPGFEGMVPLQTLRARHALVFGTEGQKRGSAHLNMMKRKINATTIGT